jgi:glycine cleavage system H protein
LKVVARVNNCNVPEEYYYNVDRHVWARIEPEGMVTIGVTDLAQHLAGQIFYAKIKPVGKLVEQFRSVATIESGQFVGSVPACVGGEIVVINEQLPTHPTLLNEDPYEKGWIARIRPMDLEAQLVHLLTGQAAVEAYREKMRRENIGCT